MRACLPATRARHTRPPRAVPHSRVACAAWFLFAWLQGAALAQETLEPARLRSGSPPVHPARVIAWGQEWLRVSVDAAGQVQGIAPLTQAPAFSEVLHQAVREWSFFPAREDGAAVLTEVLVVGVFRPAMLHDPPGLDRPTSIPQPGSRSLWSRRHLRIRREPKGTGPRLSRWRSIGKARSPRGVSSRLARDSPRQP